MTKFWERKKINIYHTKFVSLDPSRKVFSYFIYFLLFMSIFYSIIPIKHAQVWLSRKLIHLIFCNRGGICYNSQLPFYYISCTFGFISPLLQSKSVICNDIALCGCAFGCSHFQYVAHIGFLLIIIVVTKVQLNLAIDVSLRIRSSIVRRRYDVGNVEYGSLLSYGWSLTSNQYHTPSVPKYMVYRFWRRN